MLLHNGCDGLPMSSPVHLATSPTPAAPPPSPERFPTPSPNTTTSQENSNMLYQDTLLDLYIAHTYLESLRQQNLLSHAWSGLIAGGLAHLIVKYYQYYPMAADCNQSEEMLTYMAHRISEQYPMSTIFATLNETAQAEIAHRAVLFATSILDASGQTVASPTSAYEAPSSPSMTISAAASSARRNATLNSPLETSPNVLSGYCGGAFEASFPPPNGAANGFGTGLRLPFVGHLGPCVTPTVAPGNLTLRGNLDPPLFSKAGSRQPYSWLDTTNHSTIPCNPAPPIAGPSRGDTTQPEKTVSSTLPINIPPIHLYLPATGPPIPLPPPMWPPVSTPLRKPSALEHFEGSGRRASSSGLPSSANGNQNLQVTPLARSSSWSYGTQYTPTRPSPLGLTASLPSGTLIASSTPGPSTTPQTGAASLSLSTPKFSHLLSFPTADDDANDETLLYSLPHTPAPAPKTPKPRRKRAPRASSGAARSRTPLAPRNSNDVVSPAVAKKPAPALKPKPAQKAKATQKRKPKGPKRKSNADEDDYDPGALFNTETENDPAFQPPKPKRAKRQSTGLAPARTLTPTTRATRRSIAQ